MHNNNPQDDKPKTDSNEVPKEVRTSVKDEHYGRKENEKGLQPKPRFWSKWIPVEWFTFWLVIFTAIYSCTSIAQLYVTQRAWVSYVGIVVNRRSNVTPIPADDISDITVIFENSGNTPARDVDVRVNATLSPQPLPSNFGYQDVPIFTAGSQSIIGPKNRLLSGIISEPTTGLLGAKSGQAFFYLWGRIGYKDVFYLSHVTEFCVSLRQAPGDFFFDNCPRHNTAN